MGDDPKWKRKLPTRIYDYNYKVSEGYYKPQAEYMETKSIVPRSREVPPQHQTYAERFANSPWYGGTRGLPYNEDYAASKGPLMKLGDRHLRSSSLLREMKDLEDDQIPLNIRASRRKKKFEEEEEKLGIRPRFNRTVSLDTSTRSSDFYKKVKDKISSLDEELLKSTLNANLAEPPSKWSYDLDRPTKPITRHREERYALPSGGTVKKISHSEFSTYSSSKPPIIPSRSRKVSSSDETIIQPRIRKNSVGDYAALPRSSRRSSMNEDDLASYTNRAPRLREERRIREAQDFTEDVQKMVDKMRAKKVDPEAVFSASRSSRSSSVDRTIGSTHSRKRKTSHGPNFVYGIGKY